MTSPTTGPAGPAAGPTPGMAAVPSGNGTTRALATGGTARVRELARHGDLRRRYALLSRSALDGAVAFAGSVWRRLRDLGRYSHRRLRDLRTWYASSRLRPLLRRMLVRMGYLLSGLPLAALRFVLLMPLFLIGVVTSVIWLGLPILALTLRLARGFAFVERRRMASVLGRPARHPAYRGGEGTGAFRRLLAPLRQRQCWADWGHGVLGLIPAAVGLAIPAAWATLGIAGQFAERVIWIFVGWGLLLLLPAVVKVGTSFNTGFGRFMLFRDRVAELEGQVSDLTQSRDAAVSAEASALRRLERDIHDGPQQRLVRLAMDLSTVQRRLAKEPGGDVQPMLAEALAQTRETLDELRALSRGIAPPVLADRGLAAALAAVAGRSTTPVTLDIDLPKGVRLPSMVENAAYFLVAEALTNVAKHSVADHCRVHLTASADRRLLYVIVSDNGVGGAHQSKGHGLAGLSDRVRTLGGRLDIESPDGGPTVLAAELPCGS